MSMDDKPDIIEFIEKYCGVELLEYQKEILRKMYDTGPDAKIIFPRWLGRNDYRHLAAIAKELFKEKQHEIQQKDDDQSV